MFRVTVLALLARLLPPAGAAALEPPRVWCVGDSIVLRYARHLSRLAPGWNVVDLGLGGERSDEGLTRLGTLLGQRPAPDVAVIIYGANDLVAGSLRGLSGFGPAAAAANIHEMTIRLRDAGTIPIVALPVGAPPVRAEDPGAARERLISLRHGFAALRRLLRRERPRVDFRLTRHEHFVDAVHPSPEGAAILARRAHRAVASALASRRGDRR